MGTCLYPGNTSVQDVDGTVKNENEKEIFNVFSKKIARDLTMKRIVACHNWGAACGMMRGGGGGGGGGVLNIKFFGLASHNKS